MSLDRNDELNHVRGLLADYINKNKLLKEKIKELEDAYISIDKEELDLDVKYYRKPVLFEIRKEDDLEKQWEDYCEDLQADSEDESFAICVIGVKRQPYS